MLSKAGTRRPSAFIILARRCNPSPPCQCSSPYKFTKFFLYLLSIHLSIHGDLPAGEFTFIDRGELKLLQGLEDSVEFLGAEAMVSSFATISMPKILTNLELGQIYKSHALLPVIG